MRDLEIARKRLKKNNLTLVFVKDGKIIYEANSHGLKDLILVIDEIQEYIKGSSVADHVVGKAAASLFIHSNVTSVFAEKISKHAVTVLTDKNIYFEYESLVDKILNKNKTDICPFEKIALDSLSPEKTYRKIKLFLHSGL
jgi:hypothetical protein